MVPMRAQFRVEAFREPKRAAGILPAVLEPVCRRDVGSTLTSRFMATIHVKTLEVFPAHEPQKNIEH